MSAFIPVAPDRWAEMVQAWAAVGPLRNKGSDLSTQLELRQVEIDRLRAENERLRSKLSFSQSISEICKQTHEGETITVKGSISSGKTDLSSLCQCERLTAEVEWLRKADRLVCWNPATQQWEVRHEAPK